MTSRKSRLNEAVQRHPVLLHLAGIVLVPVSIIFLPIVLYAVILPSDISLGRAITLIPWVPVILVVAIAAVVSLIQMPRGIELRSRRPKKEPSVAATRDVMGTNDPQSRDAA